jgi:hypothetical protein
MEKNRLEKVYFLPVVAMSLCRSVAVNKLGQIPRLPVKDAWCGQYYVRLQ